MIGHCTFGSENVKRGLSNYMEAVLKLLFLFSLYTFIFMPFAHAGEVVYYKDGDLTLEGYLAKPDPFAFSGKRPVVLVIHQWRG